MQVVANQDCLMLFVRKRMVNPVLFPRVCDCFSNFLKGYFVIDTKGSDRHGFNQVEKGDCLEIRGVNFWLAYWLTISPAHKPIAQTVRVHSRIARGFRN